MAINPTNSQSIYAGTYHGVYKTNNGGDSWSIRSNGLAYLYGSILAIDPANSHTILAGTDFGLFKSTNGGDLWNLANTGSAGGGSGTPVPIMEGWWLLPGMLAGVGIFAHRRKEY